MGKRERSETGIDWRARLREIVALGGVAFGGAVVVACSASSASTGESRDAGLQEASADAKSRVDSSSTPFCNACSDTGTDGADGGPPDDADGGSPIEDTGAMPIFDACNANPDPCCSDSSTCQLYTACTADPTPACCSELQSLGSVPGSCAALDATVPSDAGDGGDAHDGGPG